MDETLLRVQMHDTLLSYLTQETSNHLPGTRNPEPGTLNPEPRTPYSSLEPRNPEAPKFTPNSKPCTLHPAFGTLYFRFASKP